MHYLDQPAKDFDNTAYLHLKVSGLQKRKGVRVYTITLGRRNPKNYHLVLQGLEGRKWEGVIPKSEIEKCQEYTLRISANKEDGCPTGRYAVYFRQMVPVTVTFRAVILEMHDAGWNFQEIVDHLGVSMKTVVSYVTRVYDQTEVNSMVTPPLAPSPASLPPAPPEPTTMTTLPVNSLSV